MSIVTSTSADLLSAASHLADMIIRSEVFTTYRESRKQLIKDEQARHLIARFNDWKEKYEEVQRFGKYHPDYDKVSKEIRLAKRQMDLYEPIANFKRAEREMEKLLNEISKEVADAVSPHIKVPTGNPYFDNLSCGSQGCGSGGSCGCSA